MSAMLSTSNSANPYNQNAIHTDASIEYTIPVSPPIPTHIYLVHTHAHHTYVYPVHTWHYTHTDPYIHTYVIHKQHKTYTIKA